MLDQPIVVSDDFARAYGRPLALGRHELRGLATPHDLFGADCVGRPSHRAAPFVITLRRPHRAAATSRHPQSQD